MRSVLTASPLNRRKLVIKAQELGIETRVYLNTVEAVKQEDYPQLVKLHEELEHV